MRLELLFHRILLFLMFPVIVFAQDYSDQPNAHHHRLAEEFRSWGIEVSPSPSGETVISSRGMAKCQVPLCRMLRRLAIKTGGPIRVVIKDMVLGDENIGGQAFSSNSEGQWSHTIEVKGSMISREGLASGKDPVLRHELQHALLNQQPPNHYLNGSFRMRNTLDIPRIGYSSSFSIQEFFTFADMNHQVDTGKVRAERQTFMTFGEPMIMQLLELLKSGETSFLDKNVLVTDLSESTSTYTENLGEKLDSIFSRSHPRPHLVVIKNAPDFSDRIEAYQYTFTDSSKAQYSFYSDFTYEEIKDQIPKMFRTVLNAAKPWYYSITYPDSRLPTSSEWAEFKRAFKSGLEEFRFQGSCAAKFRTLK